jgi:tetrahydromethanopterin S-methyltransferase subunit A
MKNNISYLAQKKSIFQKLKDIWHKDKPTTEEIKVHLMMNALFNEQTTEQVIDTLILFEEKAKARLKEIKKQAETDRFVTDFYLGTNQSKKVTI